MLIITLAGFSILLFASLSTLIFLTSGKQKAHGIVIKSCAKSPPKFRLHSLTISPDPPIKGNAAKVLFKGEILGNKSIEKAILTVEISYGGVRLIKKEMELCSFLQKHAQKLDLPKCPLQPGEVSYFNTVMIPKELPSGAYSVSIEAYLDTGECLFCYDAEFELKNT